MKELWRNAGRRFLEWRPAVILLVGLLATAAVTYFVARAARLEDELRFDRAVERSRTSVASRIQTYTAMLRGGAALFAGSREVSREEFRAYVEHLAAARDYPGIQGIGFTKRVAPRDLERFVEEHRAEFPDFRVWPTMTRLEYHAIIYLEPLDRRNRAAIGYDMFSEPVRRAAMERARDTGQPAASSRVTLVQEIDEEKQAGFLIYVPVYRGPHVPATVGERRALLEGYVYAPFRIADLLNSAFASERDPVVGFEVYDGPDVRGAPLHRSEDPPEAPRFRGRRQLEFAGQTWTLAFWSRPPGEGRSGRRVLALLLASGIVASLLAAWLDTVGTRERRRAREVTEYRHLVRHGERLHQLAVDHVSDHAIFRVDPDGQIASWNRGVERVFGWTSDEFVGQPYATRFATDAGDAEGLEDNPAEPTGDVSSGERWYRRKDGTRVRVAVTATSLADEQDQFAGRLVVMRDVTERALADERRRQLFEVERAARQEAERVGRMKDEFLATLSHELRTPLNAILGWAQVLAGSASNPDRVRRGIEVIARNARTQAQIVEDLLDMSRIVSGKIRLEVERLDAAALVDAALDVVRPMAAARGVTLRKQVAPELPHIAADPHRVQQVLWNLLTNGVKFTPRGGEVTVALQPHEQGVELRVSDTGQGIAPEFLPHIFEPFRQADASTTRQHGGLGLGLAIVKTVVDLHGGSVTAESAGPGHGAAFSVVFPSAAGRLVSAPAESREPAEASSLDGRLRGLSLLVVDDDTDGRELVRFNLERAGADVEVAGSAEEALNLVARARRPFDALVSDIAMPGTDGHELVQLLRDRRGDGERHVPTIALTAYVGTEHRARTLAAGFDAYLTKPFDAAALVAVIAALTAAQGVSRPS